MAMRDWVESAGSERQWGRVQGMTHEPRTPGQSDHDALNFAYAGAQRILVIAQDDNNRHNWHRLFGAHNMQLLDIVSFDQAIHRLDTLISIDAVWMEAGEAVATPDLMARLQMLVNRGTIRLVWVARDAALDQGYASFDADSVQFLSAPDEMERVAIAALLAIQPKFSLHDVNRDADTLQIQKLTAEVNRIARLLADLSGNREAGRDGRFSSFGNSQLRAPSHAYVAEPNDAGYPFGYDPIIKDATVTAAEVRNLIRVRRLRDHFFPSEIFADPAWDMLLDLMAARLSGDPVSVSSLCIAAAVPATTALRWIRTMTDVGLFVRHADPHDGRRVFIGLSDEAADGMLRYFMAVKAQTGAIG